MQKFQEWMNLHFGTGLVVDGIVGPKTTEAFANLPSPTLWTPECADEWTTKVAPLFVRTTDGIPPNGVQRWYTTPEFVTAVRENLHMLLQYPGAFSFAFCGRASYFGGAEDKNDRINNLAYMPAPRKKQAPAEYLAELQDWQQKLFRQEMGGCWEWPRVLARKLMVPAGISYFLNTDQPYCAYRLIGPLARAQRERQPLSLRVYRGPDLFVDCPIIDFGPALYYGGWPWKFTLDLSPGAYKRLGLLYGGRGDFVFWKLILKEA